MRAFLSIVPFLLAGCVVEGSASDPTSEDSGVVESDTDTDTDTDSDTDADSDSDTDADTDPLTEVWTGDRTFEFPGRDCGGGSLTLQEEGPRFQVDPPAYEIVVTPQTICGISVTSPTYRLLQWNNGVPDIYGAYQDQQGQWQTYGIATGEASGNGWAYAYSGQLQDGSTYNVQGYFELN